MLGRRFPQRERRFVHFSAPPAMSNFTSPYPGYIASNAAKRNDQPGYIASNEVNRNEVNRNDYANLLKEADKIPLPNEEAEDIAPTKERGSPLSLFNHIKDNFLFDELILVGLIILLIHEGCEDDIFIVILFYLLVFGIEHTHGAK